MLSLEEIACDKYPVVLLGLLLLLLLLVLLLLFVLLLLLYIDLIGATCFFVIESTICLHKNAKSQTLLLNVRIISSMLYVVSYLLPAYTKVAFPGQLFLPQRTYTTPPVGYLRPSPEDGSGAEPSEMKREQNNTAHIMHMLLIAYRCVLLLQMRT